ncbi:MAG: DUF6934 family protein [Cytophagales bacterium]
MNIEEYPIVANNPSTYTFVSIGKSGNIIKAVVFQEIDIVLKNMALLDYNEIDDNWSDMANTNNGDISRTMKTVLTIIIDFITHNPSNLIVIKGNTKLKILLYNRIFKNYFQYYADYFVVLTEGKNGKEMATFDKMHKVFYIRSKESPK